MGKKQARKTQAAKRKTTKKPARKKETYGKIWNRAYRKQNGRNKPAMVKKVKGKEIVKFPSDAYVRRHHPQGPWDS